MKKNFLPTIFSILLLCTIIPVMINFAHTPTAKLSLLTIFAFAYTAWGIFDHYSSSPVFLKRVAIEYFLIALIALAPLSFLIYY